MEKNIPKAPLPKVSLDELFSTQKERDEADLEKVVEIEISSIDDFPNHPFKVINNDDMKQMVESIKENGVLLPVIVRKKDNDRYEMISGHRRKFASKLAKLEKIPCIIKELTDEEATIIMVDSNMQREKILPSERAFAYKMKLEAIKQQNKKDKTSAQDVQKSKTSREIISDEEGKSRETIRRYIRLTELIPELLNLVDEETIAISPAVSLSYLKQEEQYMVLDWIEYNDATPSLSQALNLKKLSQEDNFTEESMESILDIQKPNQVEKVKISKEKLRNILPKNIKEDQYENFIIRSVEFYNKYLQQQRSKEVSR